MTRARTGQSLVFLGAGGHARVLLALARAADWDVAGICDPTAAEAGTTSWHGVSVLGGDDALLALDRAQVLLVNAVGQLVGTNVRRQVYERCHALGFSFASLIHPTAWTSPDAIVAEGVQIMAGAIVQPGCSIGTDSIVNTKASLDHDCVIGSHVHIAPGATLCGTVTVEAGAFVGAGAIVTQGRRIGAGAVVAAGVTAVRDVAAGVVMMPKWQTPERL